MTKDNDQAGHSHNQMRDEFPDLVARHHQLVRELGATEDPAARSDLSQELRRVRQQIAAIVDPNQSTVPEPATGAPPLEPVPNLDDRFTDGESSDEQFTDGELAEQDVGDSPSGEDAYAQDHYPAEQATLGQPPDQHIADVHYAEPSYFEAPPQHFAGHDLPDPPVGAADAATFGASHIPPAAAETPEAFQTSYASDQTSYASDQGHPPPDFEPPHAVEKAEVNTSLANSYRSIQPSAILLAVVGVCVVAIVGFLALGGEDRTTDTAAELPPASPTSVGDVAGIEADVAVTNVRAVLMALGLSSVVVDHRDGVIHLGGPVPGQADFDAAVMAAQAAAAGYPLDTSALLAMPQSPSDAVPAEAGGSGRPDVLQSELDRILAGTPLIFGSGQAELSELHRRILNNVVLALSGYPGFSLTVVGFTDELGDDNSNQALSLARAEAVRQYLMAEGLPAEAFSVEARGERAATSAALAGLERRVELEVNGAIGPDPGQTGAVRVAIVAPSASNDLAFTQSMVDAVNLLASETPIELSITDNTFVPDEAANAIRSYAEQGYDLVIAHGSQFGSSLVEIAPQFPETAFAWGTASDTFGLGNVYAYDAAAQQGGYVLGAVAAMTSTSNVIGVIGPIEVGDAALFVNGFTAGAKAQQPVTDVRVTYTGSFSDTGLAAEAAQAHLGVGADVLTGSAQMVVGAVAAAQESGALWFGTQADQTPLAPESVVASQVYHWEIALRPIIEDIKAGTLAGSTYTADLANGGLVIEYNPSVPLAPEVRQRADQLVVEIANGAIIPPG